MIFDKEEIKSIDSKGILQKHLKAAIQTAHDKNVIIGFRPVSPYAKKWIEKGYPTKSFVIKNKSGKEGPCQGLIAISPDLGRYDRQAGTAEDLIKGKEKYTQQIHKALEADPSLLPIQLKLTMEEMQKLTGINIRPIANGHLLSWSHNGTQMQAKAVYDTKSKKYLLQQDHEPIMVLGKKADDLDIEDEPLPITADYDLLVVCPLYKEFHPGRTDRSPLRTQSMSKMNFKKELKKAEENAKIIEEAPKEDIKGGNWTPRIEKLVNEINQDIGKIDSKRAFKGMEIVHHNAEFYNPYAADLSDSLPATIIFPHPMDLSQLDNQPSNPALKSVEYVMAETVEDLNIIRNFLKHEGYYWPTNANLKEEIAPFDPKAVENVNQLMRQRSKENLKPENQEAAPKNSSDRDNSDEAKENRNTFRK